MEKREHLPATRRRRQQNNPSFSSSLLEAIYRSIDESDSAATVAEPELAPKHKSRPATDLLAVTRATSHFTYSSSSDFSGFSSSSSDADSARIARPKPIRTGPDLTRSDRFRSDPDLSQLNPKKTPISNKKKLQDLKKPRSPSSSPGAKLAGFLNSLFTAPNNRKPKNSTVDDPSPSPSNCSSASSYSRSCLGKTPSMRGSERSVRFCPIGECSEKLVFNGDSAAAAEKGGERTRMMIKELMKGFETEEEEEDDDDEEEEESGDESDDLFELENLAGINGGFRDELPVYETTNLGMNCAIAKRLVG